MKRKTKKTWVVVADSASAQFFQIRDDDSGRGLEPVAADLTSGIHRHAADLKSDKPGRAFAGAGSSLRGAMEPHHDYHKLEKHEFVRTVAASLERAFEAHKFERLVLVAPDRSLGEFRRELSSKLTAVLWHEIPKDVTKLGPQDLWMRIAPALTESPSLTED